AKDYPLIQILDVASTPEKKSKPMRSLIIILATLVAFFFAMFLAFFREAMQRAKGQPGQAERLAQLHNAFRFKS
ncbi:MAG: GNVR domain-containing protein, partial [Gallionella sp.]